MSADYYAAMLRAMMRYVFALRWPILRDAAAAIFFVTPRAKARYAYAMPCHAPLCC